MVFISLDYAQNLRLCVWMQYLLRSLGQKCAKFCVRVFSRGDIIYSITKSDTEVGQVRFEPTLNFTNRQIFSAQHP